MTSTFKIWGERRRILLTETSEIDLLYLNKDSFCSTHKHSDKINRFVVVSGTVKIETEFGNKILQQDDSFEVSNYVLHRFVALEDSVMIELAYVKHGTIDEEDILREKQGGRIIDFKEYTEIELREKGLLEL